MNRTKAKPGELVKRAWTKHLSRRIDRASSQREHKANTRLGKRHIVRDTEANRYVLGPVRSPLTWSMPEVTRATGALKRYERRLRYLDALNSVREAA